MNEAGHESGNALVTDGRDLPWLQDVPEQAVWSSWAPTYRDVIILDGENKVVGVFNLTTHNLATPGDYDALRALFVAAAEAEAEAEGQLDAGPLDGGPGEAGPSDAGLHDGGPDVDDAGAGDASP